MTITIRVDGIPKPQPRPRAVIRGNRAGVYDPGTAESWRSSVREAALPMRPGTPISGPVQIKMRFRLPRPQSHYRTGKRYKDLKPSAPIPHTKKPDIDNLAKAVMDSLSDIGMWRDDSIVWDEHATKIYHDHPGCEITITWNTGDPR